MRSPFSARLATGLAVAVAFVAPLRADLKYTMRLETHASSVASATPTNPLMAIIGSLVTSTLIPAGGLEMVVTVGPRAIVEIRMPLPVSSEAGLPPGMPTALVMNGEAWFSSEYARYAKLAAGALGGNVFALETLAAEGFLMRSVLRGELLGDREIESVVVAIEEGAVSADFFSVPADYTQTEPPAAPLQLPK